MAKIKYDGVVEAVRYKPDGQVAWVRAYLRRGPTFSDHIIIDRSTLIQYLKSGKNFHAGQRIPYLASTFDIQDPLHVIQTNGRDVLITGDSPSSQDNLQGIPIV